MILGQRLRQLRIEKELTQADMEKRSGLLRCYISRVENGVTVPSTITLAKIAGALEIPMYRLFYDGDDAPEAPKFTAVYPSEWGSSGRNAEYLRKFRSYLKKISSRDRLPRTDEIEHKVPVDLPRRFVGRALLSCKRKCLCRRYGHFFPALDLLMLTQQRHNLILLIEQFIQT